MELSTSMPEALTRTINRRGVLLDQGHCRRQIALVAEARDGLLAEMVAITGLENPNSTAQLLPWLKAHGYMGENLRASTVREEMDAAPEAIKRVLTIRLVLAKSPVKKYQSALDKVSVDGRLKDVLVYCGAVKTGRWSSGGVQTHNMPRPIHPSLLAEEGTPERVLQDASDGLRHMLIAPDDKVLVVSDLAGIEARVLAWLAGETWALEAYARGDDLYIATYAKVFGLQQDDVDKTGRFIGKLIVLSMGYAGGLGAFMRFAGDYSMDLSILYDIVWPISEQHHKQAEWMLDYHSKYSKQHIKALTDKYGEDEARRIMLAIECIKLGWRAANPNVVRFWKDLEDAWRAAFANPGSIVTAGKCAFKYGRAATGPVMRMTLPSGTHIHHHMPRVSTTTKAMYNDVMEARNAEEMNGSQKLLLEAVEQYVPGSAFMGDEELGEMFTDDVIYGVGIAIGRRLNGGISYMASEEGTWRRCGTYGGSLAESNSQRLSRDILAYNMPAIEAAGFDIVASVHDEVITEADPGKTVEELNDLLATVPPWAAGLPLAADGYVTERGGFYRKD